jgi:hypothetical protein
VAGYSQTNREAGQHSPPSSENLSVARDVFIFPSISHLASGFNSFMLPRYGGKCKARPRGEAGLCNQLIICGRKGPASGVLITSPAGIIYARFTHGRWKREYNGFGPAWYFLYVVPPNSPCGPRWPAISQPLGRQGLFLSKRGPVM